MMEHEEWPEDDDYDEDSDWPVRCNYCGETGGYFNDFEVFICEDPDIVDLKGNGYFTDIQPICDNCCTERINEGTCDSLECSIFKKKYPKIRFPDLVEIIEKNGIKYEINDNVILSKNYYPQWGYFFWDLPTKFSLENEVTEENFAIMINPGSKSSLKLINDVNDYAVPLEIIDIFKKRYSYEVTNYFIDSKEFLEKDTKERYIIKFLIVRFQKNEGNIPPEHLVIQMLENTLTESSQSEFKYDPHQIKVLYKKIDKIEEDDKIEPIKIYFSQINLRKKFYTKEGVIINEKRDEIKSEIYENLKEAKNKGANMILFPEYCFPEEFIDKLIDFSNKERIWIIGGAERFKSSKFGLDLHKNAVLIIPPEKEPIIQLKSFSGKDDPRFNPGRLINIIESRFCVFSVLVCADFLEDSILLRLREQVDFLIIVSFNKDINEFNTRAYTKCLSNNCYIIITNILEYKGYCIHAPLREGERNLDLTEFPYWEGDLNEFSWHRRKIRQSKLYKPCLSDILYNYGLHYFK